MNKWYDTWLMNFYNKSDDTPVILIKSITGNSYVLWYCPAPKYTCSAVTWGWWFSVRVL